jgi:hypothetical protein
MNQLKRIIRETVIKEAGAMTGDPKQMAIKALQAALAHVKSLKDVGPDYPEEDFLDDLAACDKCERDSNGNVFLTFGLGRAERGGSGGYPGER